MNYTRLISLSAFLFFATLLYADANVLINPGFESGTSDWLDRNCSIEAVTSPVHGGSFSGRAYDRTDTWQGIQQNMMDKMVPGQTYQVSGWVRLENAASATVKLTMQKTDGNGTAYNGINQATVTDTAWVQLSGAYTLNVTGTLTGLYLYFEGPASGVSFFVDDVSVYGPVPPPVTTTTQVDPAVRHQTIEGIGAAGGWYGGWLTAHPQKAALYNLLFRDLGLDIYRIRNTYGIDSNNMNTDDEIIAQAQTSLGRPLKVMISSWSPEASLKSNGSTVAGTLAKNASGQYRYADFAQWWLDSLNAYAALGVTAEYVNMQNEADYLATWDSCKFTPTETADYAGYNLAFAALANLAGSMPGSPKLLAPETIGFGSSMAYINALIDKTPLYAYAHHLYGDGNGGSPDGYIPGMINYAAAYNDKPRMQTEFSADNAFFTDAINLALLLHNSFTYESAAAYLYWDLFWGTPGGLISLDNPWQGTPSYTIRPVYYAFKHYSAFIDADWQRIAASTVSSQLRTSAYISPDNLRLSVVFVNPGYSQVQTTAAFSNITIVGGQVYRTSETENCVLLGAFNPAAPIVAPARSILTLSLDLEDPATPPAIPTGLSATPGNEDVALNWNDNTEADLAGYNVYRSQTSGTGFVKLNSALLTASSYTDLSVSNAITYYYVVTAVDADENESGYSQERSATPAGSDRILLSSADFETGFGDWVNITGPDTHDWARISGDTPTGSTGPDSGALGSPWYVYLETSSGGANIAGNNAILEGPLIDGSHIQLKFYYHMFGSNIGSLYVDVYNAAWYTVWGRSTQQHASASVEYTQATIDLSSYTSPLRIRIRAFAAGGQRGDTAIDNIEVYGIPPITTCSDVQSYGFRLPADLNGDCSVDLPDLLLLSDQWLSLDPIAVLPNHSPDLVVDSQIDLYDFATLAQQWLTCNNPQYPACSPNW